MIWHSATREQFIENTATNLNTGLSSQEAANLLGEHGANLSSRNISSIFLTFIIKQFKSLPGVLLFICLALSVVVNILTYKHGFKEPLVIFGLVVAYFVFCALQEYIAKKRINSVCEVSTPTCDVLRNGVVSKTDAAYLVPGDILILKRGDYIAADARLIDTSNLHCDESQLTGNTVPCEKNAKAVCEELCPLQDRVNMVYCGCYVISGGGVAIVTETGRETELAKKNLLNEKRDVYTPMVDKLSHAFNVFTNAMLIVCAIIFIISILINIHSTDVLFAQKVTDKLTLITALAIATVPITLCGTLTLSLAAGVFRMMRSLLVTKNIFSLSKAANIDIICSDKTGTLTQNRMSVAAVFTGDEIRAVSKNDIDTKTSELLKFASLCSDTKENNDPTQTALCVACEKYLKISKTDIDVLFPRVAELPFDQERKMMTTVNMINGVNYCIVRGAPEAILSLCEDVNAETVTKANDEMCQKGLRVIALAYKMVDSLPTNPTSEELECGLTFIGLIGLSDKIRPEVINAVKLCKASGIKPIMITGDHIITATAFAKKIGILDDNSKAINGDELAALTDYEFDEQLESITVYARISPQDKLRIVKAWQKKGKTVAITGDASEDTHALLAADVGCAMGITGSHVAKGNADIIVNNDNFANCLTAVKESRIVFKNAMNAIHYLFATKLSIAVVFALVIIIFGTAPLSALQVLWLCLITGTFTAAVICLDRHDDSVLTDSFTLPTQLIGRRTYLDITWESALFAVLGVISFAVGGAKFGAAMAFLTLVVVHLLQIINIRTDKTILKANYKNNLPLIAFILAGFLFTFITLKTGLCGALGFATLTFGKGFIALILGIIPTFVYEGIKLYKLHKSK